jgi:hypothetical protein
LAVLAGLVLLAVLIVDVFTTVFVPRGGAGFVTSRLYRFVWAGWMRAAAGARHHRRGILALAGPVLLPLTVALWVAELVAAFALVYVPFADKFSVPKPAADDPSWVSSLYVSAYSATTLGVGDVYASTPWLRLLTTLEAGLGFALFSISITYVLSVYGALLRATALALQIATFLGRQAGEDAVDLICRTVQSHSAEQLLEWLNATVLDLAATGQAQAQYPLIAYFHIPRDDRALPLALSDLLQLLTVTRTLPEPSAFPALTSSPTTVGAYRAVADFVAEHADQLQGRDVAGDEDAGMRVYRDARERLQAGAVELRDDEEAQRLYLELRQQWSSGERRLLSHFGYQPRRSP